MIETPFKLTKTELLCSAAATLCLNRLRQEGIPARRLKDVAEVPQYGFTAAATNVPTSMRFLRITDIKGGTVEWDRVPYCDCERPGSYLLRKGDILVARSGSVGKSFLVSSVPEPTVFASYMIRIRARTGVVPEYLFWCFQSVQFWEQVMNLRRGSAMANVNGKMLSALEFPIPTEQIQIQMAMFLTDFRRRLEGDEIAFRNLPVPLAEIPGVVSKIEELATEIEEAHMLRREAGEETEALFASALGNVYQRCADVFGRSAIGSFADVKGGKRLPAGERLSDEPTRFPYIRVSDMEKHSISTAKLKFVPAHLQPEIERYVISSSDVYITIAGTIGYPGIIPEELNNANLTENAARLVFTDLNAVDKQFIVYMLRSPQVQEIFQQKRTIAAQPKLALHRIASTEIPLPPRAEQYRVVAELDALQAETDRLKALQTETTIQLGALLPSILDHAFRGEL